MHSAPPKSEAELEDLLSTPDAALCAALEDLPGDFAVLGVGGKMGPSLAKMLRRALDSIGRADTVYGVARFSNPDAADTLRQNGVVPVAADLADPAAVSTLPPAPNVIYMVGQKFGTSSNPEPTWVINTIPAMQCARHYAGSRIVCFSTGCVYPNVPVGSRGSVETDPLEPLGEYANAAVARERVFSYYARRGGSPSLLFRLNYAVEMRYGVLVDIALSVLRGEPIDLSMGHLNMIWQRDANAWALRCLALADATCSALNITGPETLSVRAVATRFAQLLGRDAVFIGDENQTALLSNAGRAHALLGYPTVSPDLLMQWIADWLLNERPVWNKPTHFQTRDGRY
jgi:uncharacterized protein YbjT (DUF2867 family)